MRTAATVRVGLALAFVAILASGEAVPEAGDSIDALAGQQGVNASVVRFAVERVLAMRSAGGQGASGGPLTGIESRGVDETFHGVKINAPRFQRVVMYDKTTRQYRIVRAKVDHFVYQRRVIVERTKMRLAFGGTEDGFTVDVDVSRDFDGNLAVTRYTFGGEDAEGGDSDDPSAPARRDFLDVMSVNIWNFNHWRPRQRILRDSLIGAVPDLVGFQEVRSRRRAETDESRFQVADLAELLPGYQYAYAPAMTFEEGEELHSEGLAVFSRYPILEVEAVPLSRDADDPGDFHQRLLLRARVAAPIGPVDFYVTHLSLSRDARLRTIEEIGRRVAGPRDTPAVLVGDMNCVFDDEAGDWAARYGLTDAWKALHPDQDGWTFNSWEPKSRIDYIFSRGLRPEKVSIQGAESVPNERLWATGGVRDMKDQLFPSDHMFPLARLRP